MARNTYDINSWLEDTNSLLQASLEADDDVRRDLDVTIWSAQTELERLQEEYVRAAQNAVDRLQRSVARVQEHGTTDNELGTLQGNALRLEQLDGLIMQQAKAVQALYSLRDKLTAS